MKTIRELFVNLETEIPDGIVASVVNKLHYDSRKIERGDLFFAVRGYKTDGHHYLPKVQQAQAIAAVVEEKDIKLSIPQIVVKNSRRAMAQVAANYYREALNSMRLIGITGTNGKTTTSYLIRSVLEEAGLSCGLIGTIAYEYGHERKNAWNTTPEAIDLCGMINEMYKSGQKACVLEVSSHALALERVAGLRFDGAVFTNLSRDHMDFHENEEDYFQTKAQLFELLSPNGSVAVNIDDPYGRRLANGKNYKSVTFGFSENARVRLTDWSMDINGMKLDIKMESDDLKIDTALISRFNVENILAAVAAGVAVNIPPDKIKTGIEKVKKIPGRLEVYHILPGVVAVIDYAHTPDALRKAQQAVRAITKDRLIVVFGAGGDRDRGKRPQMGAVVDELADIAIVTSDNPRTEDPQQIIDDVLNGMKDKAKRITIPDRRQAIYKAVTIAGGGDVILIAGKGHETYQEVNGIRSDFDDAQVVQEAVKNA